MTWKTKQLKQKEERQVKLIMIGIIVILSAYILFRLNQLI